MQIVSLKKYKYFSEIVFYQNNGIDTSGMDYSRLAPLLTEVAKEK